MRQPLWIWMKLDSKEKQREKKKETMTSWPDIDQGHAHTAAQNEQINQIDCLTPSIQLDLWIALNNWLRE